ncbi:hypothetical protein DSM104299_03630 [Baekduia alba]|uniref:hypothetical protein n=1 Tax=Baekduia alba TaxID=2997333 RepID=UPI00233FD34D|nr:hypothetical protein [Baekduia alba]WCB94890.1 hypothetical protein DSM104299_03630 [Baekduia alba]
MPEPRTGGSVHLMAHLAACRCAVGVAPLPGLGVIELRGSASELHEIARHLVGRSPAVGTCVRIRHGWWRSVAPDRALVLAGIGEREALAADLAELVARRLDLACADVSEAYAGLVLAGPLAGRLATSPAARLAAPTIAVPDGDDFWLLVLPRDRVDDACHVLLVAGRVDGAVAVESRVTELYYAARSRPAAMAGHPPTNPTSIGALPS